MENVLKKIVDKKREKIEIYKKNYIENKLIKNIKNIKNFVNFKDKIKKRNIEKKISIIGEIKKASPSSGVLVENFDPINIAKMYIENGIPFLSVLTEENFFQGKLDHIKNIKKNTKSLFYVKIFL